MSSLIVVTGTDTGIGKTVFAAGLAQLLGAYYWKPIQAGTEDGGDSQTVSALGVPRERILAEAHRLKTPCSPHLAAELDGMEIRPELLVPPDPLGPLVIEGAGGALVPVTRDCLYADVFKQWNVPVVVVARTELGTINHSLLTLEALRARCVPVIGVAFVGEPNEDSEAIIAELGKVKRLGRLPWLKPLTAKSLQAAFRETFEQGDFL